MAIPITIEKLLNENVVEWARIEFKEDWNPDSTLKTVSAFANDIDNWGGGYIIIGIKEDNGRIKYPIKGISSNSIDRIQKELLNYCKLLKPSFVPISQPIYYNGVILLLIWVPGGYERPYLCPSKPTSKNSDRKYYIRKLASTIEATPNDIRELNSLSHNIPFDDRVNMMSNISDLKHPIIRNYLSQIDSNLYQTSNGMSVEELARDLRLADGPAEYYKPLNVGLLFFNDNPEVFFPYSRIEIVHIPDPTGQGMEERMFSGPIDQQLKDALMFIKNNIIVEKVFKVSGEAEAKRVFNYSYDAIEEFLSNAIYHKSYQIHEPITVRIEREKIEITSLPGPDRSISDEDICNYKIRARRYRNRRIGDFLKELHLIEGRNTGIPTAIDAIKKNGSPLPKLLTDEDRTFFSVIMDIHQSFISKIDQNLKSKKTKTRDEIKELILQSLKDEEKSLNNLYESLGYSGRPSKVFRDVVSQMISEEIISYYSNESKFSAKSLLKIVYKND